jgi:hypothetical protein
MNNYHITVNDHNYDKYENDIQARDAISALVMFMHGNCLTPDKIRDIKIDDLTFEGEDDEDPRGCHICGGLDH